MGEKYSLQEKAKRTIDQNSRQAWNDIWSRDMHNIAADLDPWEHLRRSINYNNSNKHCINRDFSCKCILLFSKVHFHMGDIAENKMLVTQLLTPLII